MIDQTKGISHFTIRLKEHLATSFPELYNDSAFVEHRSNRAALAYENAFLAGYTPDQSDYLSNQVLFEGLHFSPFDLVFKIVCNEFDTVMADEELHPFAIKMLPVCIPVIQNYSLTEDFDTTPEYGLLYSEITGVIQIWIEQNGLQ